MGKSRFSWNSYREPGKVKAGAVMNVEHGP